MTAAMASQSGRRQMAANGGINGWPGGGWRQCNVSWQINSVSAALSASASLIGAHLLAACGQPS